MEDWLTRALDGAADKAANKATAKKLVEDVESLMKKLRLSLEEACGALNSTVEEYWKAKKLLGETVLAV